MVTGKSSVNPWIAPDELRAVVCQGSARRSTAEILSRSHSPAELWDVSPLLHYIYLKLRPPMPSWFYLSHKSIIKNYMWAWVIKPVINRRHTEPGPDYTIGIMGPREGKKKNCVKRSNSVKNTSRTSCVHRDIQKAFQSAHRHYLPWIYCSSNHCSVVLWQKMWDIHI